MRRIISTGKHNTVPNFIGAEQTGFRSGALEVDAGNFENREIHKF